MDYEFGIGRIYCDCKCCSLILWDLGIESYSSGLRGLVQRLGRAKYRLVVVRMAVVVKWVLIENIKWYGGSFVDRWLHG